MRYPVRHCFVTSVAIGFLWLLVTLKAPWEIEEDQNMKATGGQVATPAPSVGTEDGGWEWYGQADSPECLFAWEQRLQREWAVGLDPLVHKEPALPTPPPFVPR